MLSAAARQKSEKEQSHYQNALAALQKQIAQKGETAELLEKKAEIEARLSTIEQDLQQLDYREANARDGYVYVISNIGAVKLDKLTPIMVQNFLIRFPPTNTRSAQPEGRSEGCLRKA